MTGADVDLKNLDDDALDEHRRAILMEQEHHHG